jgi:ABC-type sugar transport system substrate-binding protein
VSEDMPMGHGRLASDPSLKDASTLSRRRFVQAGAGALSLALTGGLLAACGNDSEADAGVTFGFSHPFAEVPIVAAVKKYVKDYGEDEAWKVLLDETQAGKLQDQLATIETWITQKVTAINAYPGEPKAFEAIAKRAADAGIIWTTYAVEVEASAGGVLFPFDLSGEVTGKAAVEWINANDPEAEVLIIELPVTGSPRDRTNVPRKMILEQTQAKVVAVQPANEQVKGLQITEDTLQRYPNLSVVVCGGDDAALGAAEAFRKAGKKDPSKVWIVGQDGSEDALTALKKGDTFFRASAALDIPKLCEEVVGVTKRAIEKGWKPGDKQEYVKLAPTMVQVGDTEVIDRFLRTYQS